MPEMNEVKSDMFSHAGFDEATGEAHLRFKTSNKTYRYKMPKETFDGFMKAESLGKHFNQHIRKQHPGTLVEEKKAEQA